MEKFCIKHEEGGKVISSLWLYHVELPSRHLAVIEEVQTDRAHQKQGHATRLIKRAIEKARDLGCTCIELTAREDNPTVQRFYMQLGFVDRKNRAMRLTLGE